MKCCGNLKCEQNAIVSMNLVGYGARAVDLCWDHATQMALVTVENDGSVIIGPVTP